MVITQCPKASSDRRRPATAPPPGGMRAPAWAASAAKACWPCRGRASARARPRALTYHVTPRERSARHRPGAPRHRTAHRRQAALASALLDLVGDGSASARSRLLQAAEARPSVGAGRRGPGRCRRARWRLRAPRVRRRGAVEANPRTCNTRGPASPPRSAGRGGDRRPGSGPSEGAREGVGLFTPGDLAPGTHIANDAQRPITQLGESEMFTTKFRATRLNYANVMATIAVFIASGAAPTPRSRCRRTASARSSSRTVR